MDLVHHDPGIESMEQVSPGTSLGTELSHHHLLAPPASPPPLSAASDRKHSAPSLVNSPTQDPSTIPTPNPPKRRRAAGDITQNACTECRKKRAKVCDSALPLWSNTARTNLSFSPTTPNSAMARPRAVGAKLRGTFSVSTRRGTTHPRMSCGAKSRSFVLRTSFFAATTE